MAPCLGDFCLVSWGRVLLEDPMAVLIDGITVGLDHLLEHLIQVVLGVDLDPRFDENERKLALFRDSGPYHHTGFPLEARDCSKVLGNFIEADCIYSHILVVVSLLHAEQLLVGKDDQVERLTCVPGKKLFGLVSSLVLLSGSQTMNLSLFERS